MKGAEAGNRCKLPEGEVLFTMFFYKFADPANGGILRTDPAGYGRFIRMTKDQPGQEIDKGRLPFQD